MRAVLIWPSSTTSRSSIKDSSRWVTYPLGAKASTFDLEGLEDSASCPSQVILLWLCDGLLSWEKGPRELRSWAPQLCPGYVAICLKDTKPLE